ncbi:hypothetical protein HGRIS_008793 [Hohenbuehelia grisea]|uniref:Uncharacterized protein n=1 Tax=Hohenbuehelia grisea TaxID=104357 RepID=A0ABR3JAL2_9AGAR
MSTTLRRVVDDDQDLNPRPQKRQRTTSSPELKLSPLSPSALLISLPRLLLQPANHPLFIQSLYLSLLACRRCLRLPGLTPDIECRAWTGIAEIGLKAITAGLCDSKIPWASGIESEVEKAVSKGLLIAQKHPSLGLYRPHLTVISAKLAALQNNFKYARTLIRKLLPTLDHCDPPHSVYAIHIAHIDLLMAAYTSASHASPTARSSLSPHKARAHEALSAVATMKSEAQSRGHSLVGLFCTVLRLRILIAVGLWGDVAEALREAECHLGIKFDSMSSDQPDTQTPQADCSPGESQKTAHSSEHCSQASDATMLREIPPPEQVTPRAKSSASSSTKSQPSIPVYTDPFEGSMAAHALILGVLYYTHAGNAAAAAARLAQLHGVMDSGIIDRCGGGVVEVHFHNSVVNVIDNPSAFNFSPSSSSPRPRPVEGQRCTTCAPLYLRTTHPRALYALAFLVSSTAKRDPGGRKPKRHVFAQEGVMAWEREVHRGFRLDAGSCLWTGPEDFERVEQTMVEIKADLLSELAGVCILRSEFSAAEQHLAHLIAHTRTYSRFSAYSPRITLHHAHLAHARGNVSFAAECYEVAERLADEQTREPRNAGAGDADFVGASARAGLVSLRIGMRAQEGEEAGDKGSGWAEINFMGRRVVEECRGMGGVLEAIAQVVEACLTSEIIKAKKFLKQALNIATQAQENHLRALVLALIAAHYFHVSGPSARIMLSTADQLAAGLGAPANKNAKGGSVGNAPLRVWIGEKFLELYKRAGDQAMVEKQTLLNRHLAAASRSIPDFSSA